MVKQVTLLGVLQMLMGAMEAMVALLLLFSAVIMPAAIAQAKKSPQGDFPTEMMGALVAYYYFIGTSVLLVGILRGISGIFCFFYVGRWFIILTLFLGLVGRNILLRSFCHRFGGLWDDSIAASCRHPSLRYEETRLVGIKYQRVF